jgi:hypothetical protein
VFPDVEAYASITNDEKNRSAYITRSDLANKEIGVFTNKRPRFTNPITVIVNLRSVFSEGQGQMVSTLDDPPSAEYEN